MQADTISDNTYQAAAVNGMLLPGEHIVHIVSISPGIYWKGIAMLFVAVIALMYGIWLGLYCLAVAAVLLLFAYSTKKYLVLGATDHRVIIRTGVLNQEVLQLRYPQIESVDILYTLPGSFMGYCSLIITGTGSVRWIIPYILDGEAFRDHLMQKLMQHEEPLAKQAA